MDEIPKPLLHWFEQLRRPPDAICECSTIYEAARAARTIRWARKLDKFNALQTWTAAALIVDPRTRKYMAKLITDDDSGWEFVRDCGRAVSQAMAELDRDKSRDPKRFFLQHRNAAIRAMRAAREHMTAIGYTLPLPKLLDGGKDLQRFAQSLKDFADAGHERMRSAMTLARDQAMTHGVTGFNVFVAAARAELQNYDSDTVPDLGRLLANAEAKMVELQWLKPDRHQVRAMYLRELFSGLAHSAIQSNRTAFLSYASEVVFGESIEKREVRRLVADLAASEKKSEKIDHEMVLFGAWFSEVTAQMKTWEKRPPRNAAEKAARKALMEQFRTRLAALPSGDS